MSHPTRQIVNVADVSSSAGAVSSGGKHRPKAAGPGCLDLQKQTHFVLDFKGLSTAFTLIEVMIAIGVLGIAMLALLSLHDSNLQSVLRGQELSSASVLAQGLMSNAEMERVPLVGKTTGDFEKLYPGAYRNFRWERDVEMSGMFPDIRKVVVKIFYGPKLARNLTIVEFLHDPTPQNLQPNQQGGNPNGQPPQIPPNGRGVF